jgi:transcriptional regulator with XRE-family HTH domain
LDAFTEEVDAYVGRRVKAARVYARLGQAEQGAAIGVSQSAISRIEHGVRSGSSSELIRIAIQTRRPLGYLVTPEDRTVVQTGWERSGSS